MFHIQIGNYGAYWRQNDKSSQVYSRKLWIRGPAITATMEKCIKRHSNYKIIKFLHHDILAKGLYWLVLDLDQLVVKSAKGQWKY